MTQKSSNPNKRQFGSDPQIDRDKNNPIRKPTRQRTLLNDLQMDDEVFKQFLEAVPDGLVIVNALGEIQFVNNQIERMFGYQPEEVLGKPIELLIPGRFSGHKENREAFFQNLHSRPMDSGVPLFAARKDHTEFQADISLSPLKIAEKVYVIAAIRDVTLQKLAEKQFKQSQERYHQLLDNMLEGCQIIDFGWRYIYINNVAASQGRKKPDELLMHNMADVYPGIEGSELFSVLKQCMEERTPQHMENRFDYSDGTTSWFELSIQPVLEGIFILSIDITERKLAEESLANNEKRFRALVEQSMEEISMVDEQGTLLYESPTTRRPLGYPHGSFSGQNLFELFHPDDRAAAMELFEQIIGQPGGHREALFRLRHQDGSWRWMEGIVTNLLDEPAVGAVVINYRDVTERKQAQEELFQSEKRYRTLFEDSPISLWEEDFSLVKQQIELLLQQGVTDFQSYLSSHPEVVTECASMVRVVDVNKAALKLYQARSKEDLLLNLVEVLDEETLAHFQEELMCVVDGQTQYNWEGSEKTLTGERIDVRITWLVAPGYEEDMSKVIVSIMDVTESKKAEQALLQSDERFRSLFENTPVSIWEEDFSQVKIYLDSLQETLSTDIETYLADHPESVSKCADLVKIIDVNQASLELHGARDKTELLENLTKTFTPESYRAFRKELVAIGKGEHHLRMDEVVQTLDGLRRDVTVNWAVAPGYENSLSRVLVTLVDITERKLAEEALNESKLLFHHLIESLPQNIYAKDIDGRFVFANQHYCATQGRSLEEILGKTDIELHPSELTEKYRMDDRRVIETGQTIELVEEHQPLGEKKFSVQVIKTPLYDSKGQIVGVLGIFWDITERIQAEEEIRTRTDELRTLYELSRDLADADDLDETLNQVNRHAVESVHTSFARVMLLEGDHFVTRAAYPIRALDHDLLIGKREPISMLPYCQRILEQNKSVILRNNSQEVSSDERAALLLDLAQSLCLIPLRVGRPGLRSNQTLGLLILGEIRRESREPFTPGKLRLAKSIGDQAASAIRRMLLHEQTERRLQHLTALREIDQVVASSFGLDLSLRTVLTQVTEQLNVDAAAVWLFNTASNLLEYSAGRGFQSKVFEQAKPLRLGEGYAGQAALERRMIQISNLTEREDNPRLIKALVKEPFVSYFSVPLIAKGNIKGVLEVFHRVLLEPDDEWLGFLQTLAGQAAIAIDNATLFENLQRSNTNLILAYDTTLEGWSAALDLRDKETEGHTQRVTELTVKLAQAIGFNQQELVQIRRGALLHDIGKMGVPDRILLKPDKLTDEEWSIMRMHPTYAYQMLKPITYLGSAVDIPYCHHEKWDGTGYPRGLKGENIPLGARIFAVIDIYDALTSDRPYRKGWTREKTLNYIRELSGIHLDPQVVEAFLKMISENE